MIRINLAYPRRQSVENWLFYAQREVSPRDMLYRMGQLQAGLQAAHSDLGVLEDKNRIRLRDLANRAEILWKLENDKPSSGSLEECYAKAHDLLQEIVGDRLVIEKLVRSPGAVKALHWRGLSTPHDAENAMTLYRASHPPSCSSSTALVKFYPASISLRNRLVCLFLAWIKKKDLDP